jgi:hypothetical protein
VEVVMSISTETLDAACERIAKLEDLARNIAGLDDRNLYISSHAILAAAVREWREQARELMR